MEELRYIIKYLHGLVAHTDETWEHLSQPDVKEADVSYMLRCYFYPFLGVGALLIFLLHGNGVMLHSKLAFDAPFSFEYAFKGAVSFALGFVVGPTFARLLIQQLFCYATNVQIDKDRLDLFVHYSMSTVMLFYLFCACLPYFTFLSFIGLYILNVVYQGAIHFLRINNARGYFVTVACLSIYFCPFVIRYILGLFEK